MSYIGSTPTSQAFAPGTDTFNGDGTTVAFTLSRNVSTVNDIQVVVNNVVQQPTAYSVATSTLTFTAAPSAGTANIYVRYLSTNLMTIAPQQGSVTRQALDVGSSVGTGAMQLPYGTTAERPAIPLAGMTRFNTTLGYAEYWTGSQWATYGALSTPTIDYLVVAGGGGGGGSAADAWSAGGGGAGGMLSGTGLSVVSGTTYTITVGSGGTAGTVGTVTGAATTQGSDGGASSIGALISTVGGGGGGAASGNANAGAKTLGRSGGSGGGGGVNYLSSSPTGGSATSGQGNAGGTGSTTGNGYGAGGGGKGSAGTSNTTNAGGGSGSASSITGSSVTYAAGGSTGVPSPTNATANTGNGGNSAYVAAGGSTPSANGGSGIVVIAHPITYKIASATGTYTTNTVGTNYVYIFTGSGTITF